MTWENSINVLLALNQLMIYTCTYMYIRFHNIPHLQIITSLLLLVRDYSHPLQSLIASIHSKSKQGAYCIKLLPEKKTLVKSENSGKHDFYLWLCHMKKTPVKISRVFFPVKVLCNGPPEDCSQSIVSRDI